MMSSFQGEPFAYSMIFEDALDRDKLQHFEYYFEWDNDQDPLDTDSYTRFFICNCSAGVTYKVISLGDNPVSCVASRDSNCWSCNPLQPVFDLMENATYVGPCVVRSQEGKRYNTSTRSPGLDYSFCVKSNGNTTTPLTVTMVGPVGVLSVLDFLSFKPGAPDPRVFIPPAVCTDGDGTRRVGSAANTLPPFTRLLARTAGVERGQHTHIH